MPLFKPPVTPLPANTNLNGQTAIVTGATSGIGLELVRQLVALHASTVILAVRNLTKGEAVRRSLLASHPDAVVKVMLLDMEDYTSVQSFSRAFLAEHSALHILILNAGIGAYKREVTPSGHEKSIQVNYLSNVLLFFSLLPVLKATPGSTRVTWVGSRLHANTSLAKKAPLGHGETVLGHFDREDTFSLFSQYMDSKLLCTLFLYEMHKRMPASNVIVNSVCPGMVKTRMSEGLPLYLRIPVAAVQAVMARDAAPAAVIVLNAAIVAGRDSHGEFMTDKDIAP
jgi:NAD(P)-dependent dehydrogenase (short-subunit alcohol dehydrogenase family)